MMPSFRRLSLAPRFGTFHDCRKVFIRARCEVPGGAALSIMRSVIVAQRGREGVKLRYSFNHMISIASFLEWMFSRLRPPWLVGRLRKSRVILGDESSSHMKFLIILVRIDSIEAGIPWALVRNWVRPPIIACVMSFLP